MPSVLGPHEADVSLRFGGGVHSAASEEDINPRECVAGKNFTLDLENKEYKARPGFERVGTVPNGAQVNGFVTLRKSNGSVSFLVQAGTEVYSWDGLSTFTSVGTVASGSRLRGRFSHFSSLDDKVLITDLALIEQIAEWDGTTFQNSTFTNELTDPFGDFWAKYCYVVNERAHFGHVKDSSATLPHVLAGSKRGDYTEITVTQRPASTLNAEDPFQLTTPDLGSINGLVNAFGLTAISSEGFSMHKLLGSDAKDFAIASLFDDSAAVGDESVAYVGNDIVYGRQGRLESLAATDTSGDVEANDVSRWISDCAKSAAGWTLVYNRRLQRLYAFVDGDSAVYVLFKALIENKSSIIPTNQISPWSVWTTQHPMAFQPTAAMNMYDPIDGLEYVFMGDANGNLYRMEGAGVQDADQYPVEISRKSALFSMPLNSHAYDLAGWVKYRRDEAATIDLNFIWSGDSPLKKVVPIDLKADTGFAVYGGGHYYGAAKYGSAFRDRLVRTSFATSGAGNEFQIEAVGEGAFSIAEIGVRLTTAR